MQRNPAHMYGYYMDINRRLRESAFRWISRFDELSTEMLAGRDRFQPTTDGQFQSEKTSLRRNVRTLAFTVTKSLGVSQEKFCEEVRGRMLSEVANEEVWEDKRCRNALLQSAIWNVLYRQLFSGLFQVYGEEGRRVFEIWRSLLGDKGEGRLAISLFQNFLYVCSCIDYYCLETASAPLTPTELSEKWKSFTAIRLSEKFTPGKITNPAILPGCKDIHSELQRLLVPLSKGPDFPGSRTLKNVFAAAAGLAIIMGRQRSRLALLVLGIRGLEEEGKGAGVGVMMSLMMG
jgi:hypothetical protein